MMNQYFTQFSFANESVGNAITISTIVVGVIAIITVIFIFLRLKLNNPTFVKEQFGIELEKKTKRDRDVQNVTQAVPNHTQMPNHMQMPNQMQMPTQTQVQSPIQTNVPNITQQSPVQSNVQPTEQEQVQTMQGVVLRNIDPNKKLFRRLENGVYCYYQMDENGAPYRVKNPN